MKVSGEIKIIPLKGATAVIVTPNLGQIILIRRWFLPSDTTKRIEWLAANGYGFEASGYVVTLCNEQEIKRVSSAGCRIFDETKPVKIRQY